ncbi:heme exporter protein CcmD [Caenimonas sp. SL110]|uniref:heme exporter protein CcmD n=1 Tax=Caenimonas sp. SL110 TaxID=1450524 RepID=UPI0009E1AD3F|nr:heme exporter protein CcmD [Caenimonas sp. SL110]
MNYTTLGALIELGGYGRYVWPAYGLTLGLMLVEPWLLRRRLARALRQAQAANPEES